MSRKRFGMTLLVLACLQASACAGKDDTVDPVDNTSGMPEAMAPPGVTLVNYDRLGTGAATYEDVTRAFGSPGIQQNSSEMGGKKTATYNWAARNGSGQVTAIFENDRLISKSQFGL